MGNDEAATTVLQLVHKDAAWQQGRCMSEYPTMAALRSDTVAIEFAEAMEVDLDRHILRQENYKGNRRQVSEQSLRIPFDGWTLPALYVVVP